jgi:protein-tyrosine phosphatase
MQSETVVCHCHHGKNRSAAVCAAAMAVVSGTMTFVEALSNIRDERPIVDPNSLMRYYAIMYINQHT